MDTKHKQGVVSPVVVISFTEINMYASLWGLPKVYVIKDKKENNKMGRVPFCTLYVYYDL